MTEFWDGLDGADSTVAEPDKPEEKRKNGLDALENGDWDPPEGEREYYRHVQTGDLGWRVTRSHKDMVRLDRPKETCLPMRLDHWQKEEEHRPMARAQAAQIAFEADRKLCLALGLHGLARLEWHGLTQQHRRAWILEGPATPRIRQELYRAIFEVIGPLCED